MTKNGPLEAKIRKENKASICLNNKKNITNSKKSVPYYFKKAQNGSEPLAWTCAKHGLCGDEPSPIIRTNKPPGNLWIFSAFSQCCVNMLN